VGLLLCVWRDACACAARAPSRQGRDVMTLVWMVPVTGAAAVLFALWLAYDVLRRDTGTPAMQEIAGMIFEGAMAFLSRQYRTIAILAIVTSCSWR